MTSSTLASTEGEVRPRRIRAVLAAASSIWLGVAILAFLFVYCSIGSALPFVRAYFEKTEFEWFHFWPFDLAVVLLCVNMGLAMLQRSPFRAQSAGAWWTHAGILLLCLGSWIYFGAKVEGDSPVFRRAVVVETGGGESARMPALPGARLALGQGETAVSAEVIETQPDWPLPSAAGEGKTAFAVRVALSTSERQFIRQLVAGHPEFTADILPGQGGALDATDQRLLDETIRVSLDLEPQAWFFLEQTSAVYLREPGQGEWTQFPIHGLPRYHDRVPSREDVWASAGEAIEPRPIDLEARPSEGDSPFEGVEARVTGFLRYAAPRQGFSAGGSQLYPVVGLRLETDSEQGGEAFLEAFHPSRSTAMEGRIAFHWAESEAEADALMREEPRRLEIEVPAAGAVAADSMENLLHDDPDLPFTPIAGSDYSYRVQFYSDGLAMPNGRTLSVAVVDVKTSERQFTRWVSDDPSATRDMEQGASQGHGAVVEMDPGIAMRYAPGRRPAPITLIGGLAPNEVRLIRRDDAGQWRSQSVAAGDAADLGDGLRLRITRLLPQAREETRLAIVPAESRQRNAGATFSYIKLELTAAGHSASQWLPYHHYALPGENYAYEGRFAFSPAVFRLGDGRSVEAMYSRERRPLPQAVALEDFSLTAHIGGYSGDATSIRNWTSDVRFREADGWSEPVSVSVNAPIECDGLWFYQSSWDRPVDSGRSASGGMAYTGLGVGNRRGVMLQLLGCVVSTIGMALGFYVKPLAARRASARAGRAESPGAPGEPSAFPAAPVRGGGAALGLAILAIAALGLYSVRSIGNANRDAESEFARAVDLTPLARLAVYAEGRLKSFESFASEAMRAVTGGQGYRGQSAAFTYIDMMLRPEAYIDADAIYVKNKPVREAIVRALTLRGLAPERIESIRETGMISPRLLSDPTIRSTLGEMGGDLRRAAKAVDALDMALAIRDPGQLNARLRIVPPPSGNAGDAWIGVSALAGSGAPADAIHAAAGGSEALAGLAPEMRDALTGAWSDFSTAWRAQDAAAASGALARLAEALPAIAPGLYPDRAKLGLESWYFRTGNMTWVWKIYMASVVFLLMSVVYKWRWARAAGLGVFAAAFALHSVALGVRWNVAGRFPNANMFEAVTTSAWFGALSAFVFEWLARKTAMRNLFALGAAAASTASLMAAHFNPARLNPAIGNMMPVLHDIWLYIHVNVIIFSYCLILMAAFTSLLYLVWRMLGGGADYAAVGGAGSLMLDPAHGTGCRSAGEVFDGATMALMELAFILLWCGIFMGAIWADHSWGRPWGWDPKEVFALNTFIVFIVLIHVRAKARDKGLWTAALALAGCAVMLFNWIVINFVISGLHSYV